MSGSPVFRRKGATPQKRRAIASNNAKIDNADEEMSPCSKKVKLESKEDRALSEMEHNTDMLEIGRSKANEILAPEKIKPEPFTNEEEMKYEPEAEGPFEKTLISFVASSELLRRVATPLSLGCPLLDHALRGGLRRGALTEVVGESGCGKTQMCLSVALEAAGRGHSVVYLCTEGAFPQARLDQMVEGGRKHLLEKILIQQVRDIDHLVAVLGSQLKAVLGEVVLLIVDSLASVIRYDGEVNRDKMERANTIHKLGQSLLSLALTHNLAVLVVNQVTAKFNQAGFHWGRAVVASLGQTWATYPHTRIWLTKTSLVVGQTQNTKQQGLTKDTRLRKMQVDFSCRLPNSSTFFIVDQKGLRGMRVTS